MNLSSEKYLELIALFGRKLSTESADCQVEPELFREAGMYAWLYFLTEGKAEDPAGTLKQQYTVIAARQLKQRIALQELFAELEKNRIAFAPLKGADLAFRIYPNPALRCFGDWDIWVQKRDLKRFCALLEKLQWHCRLDCYSDHHCGMRSKGELHLEPHFSLPNFPGVSPEELWSCTEVVPDKEFQHQLPDSLNLMMLFQHDSINHFQTCNPLKLLLDMEFILRRNQVNWAWVTDKCRKWQLPHPGMLLNAFPEFFCGRYDCKSKFAPEAVKALRELMLKTTDFSAEASCVNASEAKLSDLHWLKIQFLRMRKENLRWLYPEIGDSNWRYINALRREIFRKLRLLCSGRNTMSDELKAHLQKAALIEKSWQTLPERKN